MRKTLPETQCDGICVCTQVHKCTLRVRVCVCVCVCVCVWYLILFLNVYMI